METVRNIILSNPALKQRDPHVGLVVYAVTKTPFFIVYDYDYDYDDAEVRILFVFIKGKSLDDIDPTAVEWP